MKIIIPLDIEFEDLVLEAWNKWDKSRKIFRYNIPEVSGVAIKMETDRTGLDYFGSVETQIDNLKNDFTKFYSGFKAAQRGQK